LPSCARSSFLPLRCVFNHSETGTLQNPLPISKWCTTNRPYLD